MFCTLISYVSTFRQLLTSPSRRNIETRGDKQTYVQSLVQRHYRFVEFLLAHPYPVVSGGWRLEGGGLAYNIGYDAR